MKKYLWELEGSGRWEEASSLQDLRDFYERSGNLQGVFIAIEVDEMGNRVDITNRIREAGGSPPSAPRGGRRFWRRRET
jgi:hypothetical protein